MTRASFLLRRALLPFTCLSFLRPTRGRNHRTYSLPYYTPFGPGFQGADNDDYPHLTAEPAETAETVKLVFSVCSGALGQVWPILWAARCPPCDFPFDT